MLSEVSPITFRVSGTQAHVFSNLWKLRAFSPQAASHCISRPVNHKDHRGPCSPSGNQLSLWLRGTSAHSPAQPHVEVAGPTRALTVKMSAGVPTPSSALGRNKRGVVVVLVSGVLTKQQQGRGLLLLYGLQSGRSILGAILTL